MPKQKTAAPAVRKIRLEAEGEFEPFYPALIEAYHRAEHYGGHLALARVRTERTRVIKSEPQYGGMSHRNAGTRLVRTFIFR